LTGGFSLPLIMLEHRRACGNRVGRLLRRTFARFSTLHVPTTFSRTVSTASFCRNSQQYRRAVYRLSFQKQNQVVRTGNPSQTRAGFSISDGDRVGLEGDKTADLHLASVSNQSTSARSEPASSTLLTPLRAQYHKFAALA
jgi:hypothetical protein